MPTGPMSTTNMGMPSGGMTPTSATSTDPNSTTSDIGSLLNLFGGLYGLYGSIGLNNSANTVLNQSNPFGAYRPQFAAQLSALMANPSSVTSQPGYQFQLDQGIQAIDRSALAPGGSGAGGGELEAVESFGQGLASNYYEKEISDLMTLSGANFPPANPADALRAVGGAQGSLGSSISGLGNNLNNAYNMYSKLFGGTNGLSSAQIADELSTVDSSAMQTAASDAASSGMYSLGDTLATQYADTGVDVTGDLASQLFGFSSAGGEAAGAASGAAGGAGGIAGGGAAAGGATAYGADLAGETAAGGEVATGADTAAAGAAGAGSLALGLAGVGAVLAPVLYGMSQPPYTENSTYFARTSAAMQQGFQPGQAGWGLLENAVMNPGNITQEQWDQFAQYGITPQNIMSMYSKYAAMGTTSAAMGKGYGMGGA